MRTFVYTYLYSLIGLCALLALTGLILLLADRNIYLIVQKKREERLTVALGWFQIGLSAVLAAALVLQHFLA